MIAHEARAYIRHLCEAWQPSELTALDDKMCSKRKKKRGKSPYYAFTTTVCAARSPIRCLLSDVHIRIAPSKNGIMYGIVSLPDGEGIIRGYSGVNVLIIDEAARVSSLAIQSNAVTSLP